MDIGVEIECVRKMKKGSIDELEVIVRLIMIGRYFLEIRVLDRVVVSKDFESKLGKYFYCIYLLDLVVYLVFFFIFMEKVKNK